MSLSLWIKELRAPFLTATILPVFLGVVLAYQMLGVFDVLLFLLTFVGVVLLHLGANVVNDVFDFRSGTDVKNEKRTPFSGGSGLLPQLNPSSVHRLALVFFGLGGAIGLLLFVLKGPVILVLGLIGIISGYFYTSPHVNFAGRGFGELLVGINFGVLVTVGAFFVQTSVLSVAPVLASLPLAFLITAVLYINQFPDVEADQEAGKRNLVVRFGQRRAVKGYLLLLMMAYVTIPAAVLLGGLPVLSLLGLLTFPIATKAAKVATMYHSSFPEIIPANAQTIMAHLFTGIVLVVTVFISTIL